MHETISFAGAFLVTFGLIIAGACGPGPGKTGQGGRTVTVAQEGQADVLGADSYALQKAADLLESGDTLVIGPGTYNMENSLFIPSGVVVRGTPGKTVLMKGPGVTSLLIDDGDYGESMLAVAEPEKFKPGMGLSVLDDRYSSDWDISVTTVTAVEGDTLRIEPMTLRDYQIGSPRARVQNTFPILCALEAENIVFEGITVDGNKGENNYIDGCRGGAIYLYKCKNVTIRNCVSRNYNGDGISFQITDHITVEDCESYGHAGYGAHPGTGSSRPVIKNCHLHDNGRVGLFLCWRVRHGEITDNMIENNGLYGVSIGHKDTDNLFTGNTIQNNGFCGVYFRNESYKNSGHRNVFRHNTILDNGNSERGYGFYLEPHVEHVFIENNRIAETRAGAERTQRYGVYVTKGAGPVHLKDNTLEGLEKDLMEMQ